MSKSLIVGLMLCVISFGASAKTVCLEAVCTDYDKPPVVQAHWELVVSVGNILSTKQDKIDADPYIITLKNDKHWYTREKEASVPISHEYTSSLACQNAALELDKKLVGRFVKDGYVDGLVKGSWCRVYVPKTEHEKK